MASAIGKIISSGIAKKIAVTGTKSSMLSKIKQTSKVIGKIDNANAGTLSYSRTPIIRWSIIIIIVLFFIALSIWRWVVYPSSHHSESMALWRHRLKSPSLRSVELYDSAVNTIKHNQT